MSLLTEIELAERNVRAAQRLLQASSGVCLQGITLVT